MPANLDRFVESDQTLHDPVSKKIKQLLHLQANKVELEEAVGMLRDLDGARPLPSNCMLMELSSANFTGSMARIPCVPGLGPLFSGN